jgi:transcriptional regulator
MSVIKVKKEQYEKIVDLYKHGMSQPEIANIYDCSVSTISAILRDMNVETRLGGSKNTKQDVLKMYEMYQNGKLLQEIAVEFNTTRATVSKLLKKNGFVIDRFKYHFNEHYFDQIDSQDKAYILGLLWADGHNRVDKGGVILELQEDDKELLEKINNLTENERPLRKVALNDKNPSWKNQYNLLWQSKYLSDVLNKYGMCQRKSLVLEFPKWLNEELYPHFIRGYMDGDGCVCYMKHNHKIQVSMVGTRVFLEVVQNICKNIGVKSYIIHDKRANEAICQLSIVSNTGSVTFLDWIYMNANLKMERKYNKYQQFLNSINNSCCV